MRKTLRNLFLSAATLIALFAASPVLQATTSIPNISAAPNPCSTMTGGQTIPVWLSSGNLCITLAEYKAQPPGAFNIACPNGGAYLSGAWQCNSGPRPMFSQQYLACLGSGLGLFGLCDPAGLATELITDFLPNVSALSAAVAAAQIVVQHDLSYATFCAVFSLADSSGGLPEEIASAGVDAACQLLQLFGGKLTPPTNQLFQPVVTRLSVSFNGVMEPTTSGATVPQPPAWNFGDGSPVVRFWYAADHVYRNPGKYLVTSTAIDSNGLTATATTSVTVPHTDAATCAGQVSGPLQIWIASQNSASGAVVVNGYDPDQQTPPFSVNWGDGSALATGWFPLSHMYAPSHQTTMTVTSHERSGPSYCAQLTVF